MSEIEQCCEECERRQEGDVAYCVLMKNCNILEDFKAARAFDFGTQQEAHAFCEGVDAVNDPHFETTEPEHHHGRWKVLLIEHGTLTTTSF